MTTTVDKATHTESLFSSQKLPPKFGADIIGSYSAACVVDMTPGQEDMCRACIDLRVPALVFGVTEKHNLALEEKLTEYAYSKLSERRVTTCTGRSSSRGLTGCRGGRRQ